VCVCVWFLFRCPFFVAFIGMSCLCWQVVFVCRVIESIVSGSSMRQSSESAFYGVFFAPPPIIFCFFSGKKRSFCWPCWSCCSPCIQGQHPFSDLLPEGALLTRVNKLVGLSLSPEAEKVVR